MEETNRYQTQSSKEPDQVKSVDKAAVVPDVVTTAGVPHFPAVWERNDKNSQEN